jgi:hypothetical protein
MLYSLHNHGRITENSCLLSLPSRWIFQFLEMTSFLRQQLKHCAEAAEKETTGLWGRRCLKLSWPRQWLLYWICGGDDRACSFTVCMFCCPQLPVTYIKNPKCLSVVNFEMEWSLPTFVWQNGWMTGGEYRGLFWREKCNKSGSCGGGRSMGILLSASILFFHYAVRLCLYETVASHMPSVH